MGKDWYWANVGTWSATNYGSQHWNSHECENWNYKSPRQSNGFRHEFDLWCEFDC